MLLLSAGFLPADLWMLAALLLTIFAGLSLRSMVCDGTVGFPEMMALAEGRPLFCEDFDAFLKVLLTSVANEKGIGFLMGFLAAADAGGLLSVMTLCLPKVELSLTCSISLMSPFRMAPLPGLPASRLA